ncbi:uncharacterized protein LOC144639937 [Oculina patagonica]
MVVKGPGPNLLGRDWLQVINFGTVSLTYRRLTSATEDPRCTHKNVFGEGLGTLPGTEAKIYVDPEATPKFMKSRPAPYALKAKVEQELDRLQSEGIISPSRIPQGGLTPIVPVVKQDGPVRICGDYKCTVNQVSKLDNYPISKTEDLLATLGRENKFCQTGYVTGIPKPQVTYSGYLIHDDGIQAVTAKVDAIKNAPEAEDELILATDASDYGMGAVLYHKMKGGAGQPIGYMSRSLNTAERNYSTLEKEALAIIFGIKKFNQFLCGHPFTIKTDHKPFEGILNEKKGIPALAAPWIQRWAPTLSAYQYKISYKAGQTKGNTDGLSRLPLPEMPDSNAGPGETIMSMEHLEGTPVHSGHIKEWSERDPILSQVLNFILEGWPTAILRTVLKS